MRPASPAAVRELEEIAPAESERGGQEARRQRLDRAVVRLHRVVVDHARERDPVLALRELPLELREALRGAQLGVASAIPTRPPMALPSRPSAAARAAGSSPCAALRASVAASSAERSCSAYAATAALSSGTRSARRRSSLSTSPQAVCVRLRARVSRL